MKQIAGIWLPDDDDHFEFHLTRGPRYEGAGSYQLKKIQAALQCCPMERRRLAVDVGGHVGTWSRVLAKNFESVVAFEPLPDLADCFDLNLQGCENVRLVRSAVSTTSREILIERTVGNSGNSCVVFDEDETPDPAVHKVCAVRLDDLDLDPDLIKIDVEGWETPVIIGAERTIRSAKPVLVVEQKPAKAETYGLGQFDAVRLLQSWGASILWEKAGDFCLAWT